MGPLNVDLLRLRTPEPFRSLWEASPLKAPLKHREGGPCRVALGLAACSTVRCSEEATGSLSGGARGPQRRRGATLLVQEGPWEGG